MEILFPLTLRPATAYDDDSHHVIQKPFRSPPPYPVLGKEAISAPVHFLQTEETHSRSSGNKPIRFFGPVSNGGVVLPTPFSLDSG